MPLPPSSWAASMPVTAKQLNTDLYTYNPGNNHTPNGILFHANRPTYIAALQNGTILTQATSGTGTWTIIAGVSIPGTALPTPTNWKNFFDNASIFGSGADYPSNSSSGSWSSNVPGSSGTPIPFVAPGTAGTPISCVGGGYYLTWGYTPFAPSISAGAAGAGIFKGYNVSPIGSVPSIIALANAGFTPTSPGDTQLASTVNNNCAYVFDMVAGGTVSFGYPLAYQLAGFSASTGSGYNYSSNNFDYSGQCVRFYETWAGVSTSGSTVSSLPVPQASYSSASTITSSFLNSGSGIAGPLAILNNPPLLRAYNNNTTSISASATTIVTVATTGTASLTVDTYSGFSSGTYTVPLSGLYLCHGRVPWSASSTASSQIAGIQVNGTAYWGPAYSNISVAPSASSLVWIMDLNASDTVNLVGYSTIPLSLSGSSDTRLVMSWLGSLGTPVTAWSAPDATFRWQAGIGNKELVSQFNAHLSNDISFLMQRPYFLSYQSSAAAQSGLAAGIFSPVKMDQIKGVVHGSAGDNFSGWNAAGNKYVAQVDGWYMVNSGYIAAGTSTPFSVVAGITQNPAGQNSPDQYQQISVSGTALSGGAEGCGIYYLRAGDSVSPACTVQSGGTWATRMNLSGTVGSHFEVVWLSE